MSNSEVRIVKDNTFEIIHSAVNKMVDFIRPTLGPAGNKIIIARFTHKKIVDDGVATARDFELPDPAENEIVKTVREVAISTNDRVGDGTTGALIILQAIINEVARKSKIVGHKIEAELKRGLEDVRKGLRKQAKHIKSKEDLKKVAVISYNNEPIAEM